MNYDLRTYQLSLKVDEEEEGEIAVLPISIPDCDGPFYSDAGIFYR